MMCSHEVDRSDDAASAFKVQVLVRAQLPKGRYVCRRLVTVMIESRAASECQRRVWSSTEGKTRHVRGAGRGAKSVG